MSQQEFNQYSVRFELQADYLAGVVARYMAERGYLEPGDLEEALSAASAVGDDHIRRRCRATRTRTASTTAPAPSASAGS